uniref:hypothetical protein n=1 Tax=Klebsiella quasipneumoniae TaxID=1463165 RepID=UPI0034DE73DE
MKKILVSFVAIMAVASSAMAAETMNMHDQVNNAQAPAHQMQSTSEKSAVQGDSMTMMDMSGHDQAAMTHEMMQNGNASAHQDMAEMHKKMMKAKPENTQETAKEGANKQVISSQADSLIKISRIWADFFPANTSNQP